MNVINKSLNGPAMLLHAGVLIALLLVLNYIMSRLLPRTTRMGVPGWRGILLLTLVALPMVCRPNPEPTVNEIILSISKEGEMTLQNENVTLDELPRKLEETVRQYPQTRLAIQADQRTSWAKVSKAFDAAKAAHMNVASTLSKPESPSDWSNKQSRGPGLMRPAGILSAADVDALEAKLVENPEDFSARRDLLTYYGFRDRGAKAKHVLWIIEHHPEYNSQETSLDPNRDGPAYSQGKTVWLKQVKDHPTNTVILGNAAAFLLLNDRVMAEELLKKAQVLQPQNPVWSDRLGQLYRLDAMGQPGTNFAAKALAEFERAQALTSPAESGSPRLKDLATMAFAAGNLEKARTYADELLGPGMKWSNGGNAGDALYHGNIILGRIALREGKIEEAKKHLLEASKTKGSPVLGSFGPNMSLAKELLEKGETNAVLQFFQECERFWPSYGGENKTAKWANEVKEGKMPDFGANLVY
jgi:tetratricopeptide (TPR) repeat protein